MDRKKSFAIIIAVVFLLDLLIGRLLYNAYVNADLINTDVGFASYTANAAFVSFVLSSAFYVLILFYIREDTMLLTYSALSLLVGFCFAGFLSLSNYYAWETIIVRLYAGISYVLAFVNIILATSIVLKEIHPKFVSISLIYMAVFQFVFGTLVADYIRGYLVGFFGPSQDSINAVFRVYDITLIILQISVVVIQIIAIRQLIDVQEGRRKVFRTIRM